MIIKISGERGEGAGFLTNLAIEKLLETYPNCICFLIDDTSEFLPLINKLKGIDVNIAPGYMSLENYQEYLNERLGKHNFFRILYPYHEYKLEDIENSLANFADKLRHIYNRRVFVIYKSAK